MSRTLPSHTTSALIDVPMEFAFTHLSKPEFVGGWALGCMGLKPVSDRLFKGHSLFTGDEAFVEIQPHPSVGLIDFVVGSATERHPYIFIRVTPGEAIEHEPNQCLVILQAVRPKNKNEDSWARTCITHETEILLIKEQLQTAYLAVTK